MIENSTIEKEFPPVVIKNGVMVLSGYGISLQVDNGYLVVKDGFGRQIRKSSFHKITKIKWVVIHGVSGFITLAALKWLHEIGASIVHVGWDGEIYHVSTQGREDIRLRRQQYKAKDNETGIDVSRYLIAERLKGQWLGLKTYFPKAACTYEKKIYNSGDLIQGLLSEAKSSITIPEILGHEALAAVIYWKEIQELPVRYSKSDLSKIPEHWKVFGPRPSRIQPKANRNATSPGNAMLNYLFSLLYAETKLKILQAGLDPQAGIFHADEKHRDNFVYDVMEAGRYPVEKWLLDFILNNELPKNYFYEQPDGVVRITLKLAPMLCETVSNWGKVIEPTVQQIKRILVK